MEFAVDAIQEIEEKNDSNVLSISLDSVSSHLTNATITIANSLIEHLHDKTLELYKTQVETSGLKNTLRSYLEYNYKDEIHEHLKKFFYHYLVLDYLFDTLAQHKIKIVNSPRLIAFEYTAACDFVYRFQFSVAAPIVIREWKHFAFKAPRRKNYKDLDKQVELFLKKNHELAKQSDENVVNVSDWVNFTAIVDPSSGTAKNLARNFWVKITPTVMRHTFVEELEHKKIGATFITTAFSLGPHFDNTIIGSHEFSVVVNGITKGNSFSLDALKTIFRLPNKMAVHEKLIEVFSYRNDISQRRSIIEEMFHLLFSKHRFEIPKHLILRRQETILQTLRSCPDYQAYKSHSDFDYHVAILAEKQLKEEILIDEIACTEKIKIDTKDVAQYLNLLCNKRMREFLYFRSFFDTIEQSIYPVQHGVLKQALRREKTLNHVLHHLMR